MGSKLVGGLLVSSGKMEYCGHPSGKSAESMHQKGGHVHLPPCCFKGPRLLRYREDSSV